MNLKTSDLLDFYYDELYPQLQVLEEERKKVGKKILWVVAVIGSLALYLIWYTHETSVDVAIQIVAIALGAGALVVNWIMTGYRRKFKHNIFRQIVARIDPTLIYSPTGMVPKTLFQLSGLFDGEIDHYTGNDLIKGKIGETPIEFSDLKVEKESTDSKGRRHRHTIFSGTFIMTEFHKNFRHTVRVYPDVAEKYLGVFGGWLQGVADGKLVRMDSPAFEKEFKVIADDPVEAHYLLTPNIMEKLVLLKKKADAPIYLSFKLDKLFIAIANGGAWFEPTLFKSLLSLDVFKSYVENLDLVLGIVEELNLNRRIWSKS